MKTLINESIAIINTVIAEDGVYYSKTIGITNKDIVFQINSGPNGTVTTTFEYSADNEHYAPLLDANGDEVSIAFEDDTVILPIESFHIGMKLRAKVVPGTATSGTYTLIIVQ